MAFEYRIIKFIECSESVGKIYWVSVTADKIIGILFVGWKNYCAIIGKFIGFDC